MPCVSITGLLAVFVWFKPQTVMFIEIEMINLITNWDGIFWLSTLCYLCYVL